MSVWQGSLGMASGSPARPTVIAFVVLGGALAGVFTALITLIPGRIGERRAQHVIAWQVGAAAPGGASGPV